MLVFMLHRLGHYPLQFQHNWHPNLCGLTSYYPPTLLFMTFLILSACFLMILKVELEILMTLSMSTMHLLQSYLLTTTNFS
jgi:hypothetical protein